MNDLTTRVIVLETKMARIVSDIESEKGTRARSHTDLHGRFDVLETRLRRSEFLLAGAGGAIVLLQVLSWFKN
jgi:hypothetical protein